MNKNIALIGCGAISRNFYLPALAKLRSQFDSVWLVDPSEHAMSQARRILPEKGVRTLDEVKDELSFVIIAAPNHAHFSLAWDALARGANILIEKPFVIWPDEGRKLIWAAAERNQVIAVNQTRRFFPLARLLRDQIRNENFGSLQSIEHWEGTKLTWPFESGAGFAKGAQRTGVVMDFGVHVLDFYHYVLEPEWRLISATHDGFCGPEGLAEIDLQADGVPISIRLSRYHTQKNIARMVFDRAEVSFDVYDSSKCSVRWRSSKLELMDASGGGRYSAIAEEVILNFLAASKGECRPVCDAASSLPVIEILDEVYNVAQRYPALLGAV